MLRKGRTADNAGLQPACKRQSIIQCGVIQSLYLRSIIVSGIRLREMLRLGKWDAASEARY